MTKHYLANGDEIKVGEVYKTRDGSKAFISYIGINSKGKLGIVGMIVDSYLSRGWGIEGNVMVEGKTTLDLVSLWKDESVTKCDQLIEVTDEIVGIGCIALQKEINSFKDEVLIALWGFDLAKIVRPALEAIFAHIATDSKNSNNSIFDSFPPENPILDGEKQGEWIEWRKRICPDLPIETKIQVKVYDGEVVENFIGYAKRNFNWDNIIAYRIMPEQAEPKKQTLYEFMSQFAGNMNINSPEENIAMISNYLEQSK